MGRLRVGGNYATLFVYAKTKDPYGKSVADGMGIVHGFFRRQGALLWALLARYACGTVTAAEAETIGALRRLAEWEDIQ